jgi:beta-glucanase (GH16 family)
LLNGSNYTSGRINTQGKQEFKYGTIEARIKMPAGSGLWPAFWMLGANIGEVSWPRCGETDIMETIDGQSNVYGTVRWNASTGTAQLGSNATNIDVTQWHVYQIDWNPTSIVWSIDGVQFYSVNTGAGSDNMAAFQNKQFMVLNLAVGGNWPGNTIDDTKMPATMSVDYVRVYQTPEEAAGDYGTLQTDDSTNLLKNPNFKYGTQGWTAYVGDSWIPCSAYFDTTAPSVPNGMSLIMKNIGGWLETDSQWAIQLYQDGIPLQAGQSYSLKYQIHSNKDKNVSVYVTDEDTGATYYSSTYKINAYQTENMIVNLASIPNNITNAKVCFAVGAQGDDLATNSCDLSITQLKLATTANIGTLTPISVPTITPLLATGTYASWKNTAITYPTAGQLVPAGPINVQWANFPNVTNSYSIYLDNNLISTVAPTSAATMTYQIYPTNVSQHELKIVANLTAGGTVTANLREFFISKKGMGTGANYIQDTGLSWYYNWSTTPVVGFSPLAQWIPMIWGTGDYGTTFLTNPANKQYQAVLGYNEPDMASQSNVSVADAVAALPTFVNSGIRVGSPATATPICNSPWFSQYMTQAHANNLDVSFIALHTYMATADPAAFLALIDSTYQKYGKPIWITEFGCADWTQNTFSGNSATAKAQVSAFMVAVLPALDSRSYVERYAWFPFDDTDQWGGASGLYDVGTGELNQLGLQYRSLGNPAGYILPQLDGYKPVTDFPQDSIVDDTTGVITRPSQTNTVATPTITPATGTFTSAQSVTIADGTTGSTIRYTTDGSTPTETNGTVYAGAFNVTATTTINAIAYMSGSTDSAVASSTITINLTNTNLALNKTATASSVNGANTAALAFDSDTTGTRWESVQGVDPQWIEVDLGATHSITGAKLVWETAAAKAYTIQVSTDNTNWTTVYSESNGTGGTENPTFSAVNARYVRMYGTARTTQYGYSLWDFEVFGS